jgi:carboxyl-terminal processing protease
LIVILYWRDVALKRISIIFLIVFISFIGCDGPEQPAPIEVDTTVESQNPDVDEGSETDLLQFTDIESGKAESPFYGVEAQVEKLTGLNLAKAGCELICQDKFDRAGELIHSQLGELLDSIDNAEKVHGTEEYLSIYQLNRLARIIQEYKDISQRRKKAKEADYTDQLAELQKSQAAADVNGLDDVNDITSVLSIIATAAEFASEQQKPQLLSRPFVKLAIEKSIEKAEEFQSKGQWLDAYLTCYSWLQVIDKENKLYSDYADELLDKANIVASFEDSPCETSKERFMGIKKEMFIRAVDLLDLHYVDLSELNYRQMVLEAIKRCRLLAEVIKASFSQIDGETAHEVFGEGFELPEDEKLMAWSASLNSVAEGIRRTKTGINKSRFLDVFEEVLTVNDTTAQLPRTVLIAHFAEAALGYLDPYTVMIWPRNVQDFDKMMTNEFTGIGIEISKQKGLLTVMSLLPGTPAYKSGLDAEDVIEAVDGVPTKDMTLVCAVKMITGPAGTDVTLTVRSSGADKSHQITITRARITVPTIRGWKRTEEGKWLYIIDQLDRIGYIRITSFSEKTSGDLEKILDKLERDTLKGLILDLRFNSGGLLTSAVDIADKFIREGLIVRTQPRGLVPKYNRARKARTHPDYPLVVLVNSSSASASEIVAGALADEKYNRAVLVGTRTHGKGSVQTISDYPGGGARIKYTMAYYHLPSGQKVESQGSAKKQERQDWGVGPDVEIKLTSAEHKKRFDVVRDNDVLVKAGHDNDIIPLEKHTIEETLATDPQLAVGVLIIKTKLVERSLNPESPEKQ